MRVATIKKWTIRRKTQGRDDKKALLRASEEGMEGDNPSEVLRKIKLYLGALADGSSGWNR